MSEALLVGCSTDRIKAVGGGHVPLGNLRVGDEVFCLGGMKARITRLDFSFGKDSTTENRLLELNNSMWVAPTLPNSSLVLIRRSIYNQFLKDHLNTHQYCSMRSRLEKLEGDYALFTPPTWVPVKSVLPGDYLAGLYNGSLDTEETIIDEPVVDIFQGSEVLPEVFNLPWNYSNFPALRPWVAESVDVTEDGLTGLIDQESILVDFWSTYTLVTDIKRAVSENMVSIAVDSGGAISVNNIIVKAGCAPADVPSERH